LARFALIFSTTGEFQKRLKSRFCIGALKRNEVERRVEDEVYLIARSNKSEPILNEIDRLPHHRRGRNSAFARFAGAPPVLF